MKKFLLVTCFIALSNMQIGFSQAWQWAYASNSSPRSQAVTIKEDQVGNYYVASYTDSVSTRLFTSMEYRDLNKQLIWQKQILGNATITDLEINAANHAVVVGYFTGNIVIDGNNLMSISPSDNSAFIFETDAAGTIQWAHALNPVGGNFKSKAFYIAADGTMYLTSEVSGNFGFCAFHQLDATGNIIKNEFNNNFENRTYSNIITDSAGNVFISGTCGSSATFDTINSYPGFSYQNFLVKYDSSFHAQWLLTREYGTFDDNNGLGFDGQSLYWAFNEFTSNADTLRLIKCDVNGNVQLTIPGPMGNSFFPSVAFAVDRFGNSVLVLNAFTRFYMYRYDASFNITWTDTIYTGTSGFPINAGLSCYDSSFYLTSYYFNDTLLFDNIMVLNPNTGANYPSDIFVAKWSVQVPTGVNNIEAKDNSLQVYPNPAREEFTVYCLRFTVGDVVKIYDALGNVVYYENLTTSNQTFQTLNLRNGVYLLNVTNVNSEVKGFSKLVVMH